MRRRIETTIETSGGGKDVLNAVYSRLQEGILGGSNTMDDSIRSREASKEVREFMFGSDEALETRRSKRSPFIPNSRPSSRKSVSRLRDKVAKRFRQIDHENFRLFRSIRQVQSPLK